MYANKACHNLPSLDLIPSKISPTICHRLAQASRFVKRKRGKINPFHFLQCLCSSVFQAHVSLRLIASQYSFISGRCVSKQAIAKRINQSCVDFVQLALFEAFKRINAVKHLKNIPCFHHFKSVLLQDSTNLKLPEHLAEHFPGAKNQTGKKNATMKIQAIYDLLHERFVHFGLGAFTRNDQTASKDILSIARKGDLIIRDLGYFVIDTLKQLANDGIFFLSRLQLNVGVYHTDDKRFDLLKELKQHNTLDITVCLGQKQRLPVRLVAVPVPEEVANERRRKAKHNRDRRCNPSKRHLALLGWQIMITNVDRTQWSTQNVANAYFVRWRIEIIFKAWKSHFNLKSIPNGNKHYVTCIVLAKLLFITCFQVLFDRLNAFMQNKHQCGISILKFASIINNYATWFFSALANNDVELITSILKTHCTYEKRNNFRNFHQQIAALG